MEDIPKAESENSNEGDQNIEMDENPEENCDMNEEQCAEDSSGDPESQKTKDRGISKWEVHEGEVEIYDIEEFAILHDMWRERRIEKAKLVKIERELNGEDFAAWWTPEITELRAKFNAAKERLMKGSRATYKKVEYKEARNAYQHGIRRAKEKFIEEFGKEAAQARIKPTSQEPDRNSEASNSCDKDEEKQIIDRANSDSENKEDSNKNQTFTDVTDKKADEVYGSYS